VQQETGVPIGLIQDCLGGMPSESWMSPATLHTLTAFERPMAEIERHGLTLAHAAILKSVRAP
jgi:hypothetical protein